MLSLQNQRQRPRFFPLDSEFDRFFQLPYLPPIDWPVVSRQFYPQVITHATNDEYHIALSIPGGDQSHVTELSVSDNKIKISGKVPQFFSSDTQNSNHTFYEELTAPFEKIDSENVDAEFKNGVLLITAKSAAPTQQKITIK